MRAVYSLSTSAERSNGVGAERRTDESTQTERSDVTERETGALFFNLARSDKTDAFRDLTGGSAPVHHLDSPVSCLLLIAIHTHWCSLPVCVCFCLCAAESPCPPILQCRHSPCVRASAK